MNEQKRYTEFMEKTKPQTLDQYCGMSIEPIEKKILEDFIKPRRLLDLGCGSGNRLFPYYFSNKIDFLGVDGSANFISASRFPEKIVHLDITNPDFGSKFEDARQKANFNTFDTIVLFGCVINAFLNPIDRQNAWDNISLLSKLTKQVVIHTFYDVTWFHTSKTGEAVRISKNIPHQYAYSASELMNIYNRLNLIVTGDFNCEGPEPHIRNLYQILKP